MTRLVHFSKDFEPYHKKRGEYRLVGDNIVAKLMDEYEVVDRSWKNVVLIRALRKLDIKGYLPYQTNIMDIETAMEYLNRGEIEVVDDGRGNIKRQTDEQEGIVDVKYIMTGNHKEPDYEKVNGHWPYGGVKEYPRLHIMVQMELWLQCSDKFADSLIDRMVEKGYWQVDGDIVRQLN